MSVNVNDRKQTIVRLDGNLLSWAKRYAKEERTSLNGLVESLLIAERRRVEPFPSIKVPDRFSPQTERFCGILGQFTQEELDADDRLAYIMGK